MRKLGDSPGSRTATVVSARVRVADIRVEATFRRRVQRTIAVLEDETGTIDATWFGRRFIERRLHAGRPGHRVRASSSTSAGSGRSTTPTSSPRATSDELLHVGRIVPVYRLTAGLTAVTLRRAVREALDRAGAAYPEYLPAPLRDGESIAADRRGARGGPLPDDVRGARRGPRAAGVRRAAGAPARAWSGGGGSGGATRRGRSRSTTRPTRELRGAIEASLGRKLDREVEPDRRPGRGDRRRSAPTSRAPTPMLRLLQGDVGSGKTAVAAWALAAAARAGLQGALLAPTDLLARQHHRTLTDAARGRRPAGRAADRLADGRERDAGRSSSSRRAWPRSSSGRTR